MKPHAAGTQMKEVSLLLELTAFLGNPGSKYAGNRHNAPWLLVEKLVFYRELSWKAKFKGRWADIESSRLPFLPEKMPLSEETPPEETLSPKNNVKLPPKIQFLMPGTFMNLSGESVFAAASFFKIPPEKIIVVHDELELPLGVISLKFSGGLGGHNGLRSMKEKFGTADFWRLRIGIGRPDGRKPGQGGPEGSGKGIVDWVLSDFGPEEVPLLEPSLEAGAGLLSGLLRYGPETFLPEWSKKKVIL